MKLCYKNREEKSRSNPITCNNLKGKNLDELWRGGGGPVPSTLATPMGRGYQKPMKNGRFVREV